MTKPNLRELLKKLGDNEIAMLNLAAFGNNYAHDAELENRDLSFDGTAVAHILPLSPEVIAVLARSGSVKLYNLYNQQWSNNSVGIGGHIVLGDGQVLPSFQDQRLHQLSGNYFAISHMYGGGVVLVEYDAEAMNLNAKRRWDGRLLGSMARGVTILPDEKIVISSENNIRVYDINHDNVCLRTFSEKTNILPNNGPLVTLPDHSVACAIRYPTNRSIPSTVNIWNPNTGAKIRELKGKLPCISDMVLMNNRYLVVAEVNDIRGQGACEIAIWDIESWECTRLKSTGAGIYYNRMLLPLNEELLITQRFTTDTDVKIINGIGQYSQTEILKIPTEETIGKVGFSLQHNGISFNPTAEMISRFSLLPNGNIVMSDQASGHIRRYAGDPQTRWARCIDLQYPSLLTKDELEKIIEALVCNASVTKIHWGGAIDADFKKQITQLVARNVRLAEKQATDSNYTLLHLAASEGDEKTAKALLEKQLTSVNAASTDMHTPLHEAARNGHTPLVVLLLDYKADIFAKTESGKTAFNLAKENRHFELANHLQMQITIAGLQLGAKAPRQDTSELEALKRQLAEQEAKLKKLQEKEPTEQPKNDTPPVQAPAIEPSAPILDEDEYASDLANQVISAAFKRFTVNPKIKTFHTHMHDIPGIDQNGCLLPIKKEKLLHLINDRIISMNLPRVSNDIMHVACYLLTLWLQSKIDATTAKNLGEGVTQYHCKIKKEVLSQIKGQRYTARLFKGYQDRTAISELIKEIDRAIGLAKNVNKFSEISNEMGSDFEGFKARVLNLITDEDAYRAHCGASLYPEI